MTRHIFPLLVLVCVVLGLVPPAHSKPIARRAATPEAVRQASLAAPPDVAAAYVVMDLDSGHVLAAKNPHDRRSPASTLKLLTAITLLPRLDKQAEYVATEKDTHFEGTAVGLRPGKAYTIDQLFHAMLLPSANDAANALARANGGMDKTLEMMNKVAMRIGAYDTRAATPSGLEPNGPEKQHSTAYDLALITRAGMQRADFQKYVQTGKARFPSGNGGTYPIYTTNRLLGSYDGMIGVKTGYTSKAGNTMVAAAERNGRRIVVTALRISSPTYPSVARLLDWGFRAAGKVQPVDRISLPVDPRTLRAPRAFVL